MALASALNMATLPARASGGIASGQPLLPTIELSVGPIAIHAEVADTEARRETGLMGRTRLPADQGMLFVFDKPDVICFWMKNTPLPLSIAFVDAQGRIVNLADMQPLSEAPHCAARPILYALEMNQGWFARYGIKPDELVRGLPAPALE